MPSLVVAVAPCSAESVLFVATVVVDVDDGIDEDDEDDEGVDDKTVNGDQVDGDDEASKPLWAFLDADICSRSITMCQPIILSLSTIDLTILILIQWRFSLQPIGKLLVDSYIFVAPTTFCSVSSQLSLENTLSTYQLSCYHIPPQFLMIGLIQVELLIP